MKDVSFNAFELLVVELLHLYCWLLISADVIAAGSKAR